MALTVYPLDNYDSWISQADAEDYFSGRLHADAWKDTDSLEQEQALRTAFRSLQELTLNLADLSSIDQDRRDALLTALETAQCEQALHELQCPPAQQIVSTVGLGEMLHVSFGQKDSPPRHSPRANAMLKPYLYVNTLKRAR